MASNPGPKKPQTRREGPGVSAPEVQAPTLDQSSPSVGSEELRVSTTDAAPAHEPEFDSSAGVGLLDAEEGIPSEPSAAAGPEHSQDAPKGTGVDPATTTLTGKDRAAWVKDVSFEALSTPNRQPFYLHEATNAAYHIGGGKDLKDKGMKEALNVGSMIAFVRLSEVNYIPQGRTIQDDSESLTKNIKSRLDSIQMNIDRQDPNYKASAEKNAGYEREALKVIEAAGALAVKKGDQNGVRALNAILVGQANASFIGYRMRQEASEKKDNFPTFRASQVNQGTRGIKDPEHMLKMAKKWMSYEVSNAHREQKPWDNKVPGEAQADARARAEAGTKVSHLFAVPSDFTANQNFLEALGRRSNSSEPSAYQSRHTQRLTANQKEAVAELKTILQKGIEKLPPEFTEEVGTMMALGVDVKDRSGAEITFTITDVENQKQLYAHMQALVGEDSAKAEEASNYFAKMPRSRELAAAIAENA